MKIEDLTIGQAKELVELLSGTRRQDADRPRNAPRPGEYVLVRCRDAGVHCGILEGVDRATATVWLSDSRRLWRWWSRFTLSELADEGVRQDKVGECKFSAPTPSVVEIVGYCELRPCSIEAEKTLREVCNANP